MYRSCSEIFGGIRRPLPLSSNFTTLLWLFVKISTVIGTKIPTKKLTYEWYIVLCEQRAWLFLIIFNPASVLSPDVIYMRFTQFPCIDRIKMYRVIQNRQARSEYRIFHCKSSQLPTLTLVMWGLLFFWVNSNLDLIRYANPRQILYCYRPKWHHATTPYTHATTFAYKINKHIVTHVCTTVSYVISLGRWPSGACWIYLSFRTTVSCRHWILITIHTNRGDAGDGKLVVCKLCKLVHRNVPIGVNR